MTPRHLLFICVIYCTALALSSCHSGEQAFSFARATEKGAHADTLRVLLARVDSLRERDSIYIREWAKGDTVFVERTRERAVYRLRLVHDTVVRVMADTLRVSSEKKEERQTQGTLPARGLRPTLQGAFVALVCGGCVWLYILYRKR